MKYFRVLSVLFFFVLFIASCGEDKKVQQIPDNEETSTDSDAEELTDNYEHANDNETQETDDTVSETDEDINDEEPLETVEFDIPDPAVENHEAVIVTKDEFAQIFSEMAAFHTMTGISTKVITIETICAGTLCNDEDPKKDTAKAVKDHIRFIPGLKYLILGGDIEVVPSRKVHDKYSNVMAGTFEDDFQSDFYYADFSDWDSNGNGIYAEDADILDYSAEIAVGRIPVSTVEEALVYFEKLIKHNTDYNTSHVKSSLLIANVATNFSGIDINAGYYFETEGRTRDIIPFDFFKRKLYTKTFPSPANDAEPLNNDVMKQALEGGVNVVVHNGHGYPTLLSCEQANNDNNFTSEMAYALKNTTFPIFLSCACQAGQFEAPFEYTYEYNGETKTRVFTDDAAGEKLVNAPEGGSVFYLGNAITGLGLAGGSQFIDEMLRDMFTKPFSVMGQSYLFAHNALKKNDTFAPPIPAVPAVPVVDEDSWKWTKKGVVALGSPLVTFWRDPFPAINAVIGVTSEKVMNGYSFTLSIPDELAGFDLRIYSNGKFYTLSAVMPGTETLNIEGEDSNILFALLKPDHQPFFQKTGL
ncbi:MAG TPA: C25 family cysteine peptidase [bacterium]|nr:C25 family cysteine peptidase [bacterium]HPY15090.1 C25 family cysteine peptidase [bacterium]HQB09171.1 C25 family cysteine peptidase [bacterium]HQM83567.1 C25 family cysteine peptidase [bacterium]